MCFPALKRGSGIRPSAGRQWSSPSRRGVSPRHQSVRRPRRRGPRLLSGPLPPTFRAGLEPHSENVSRGKCLGQVSKGREHRTLAHWAALGRGLREAAMSGGALSTATVQGFKAHRWGCLRFSEQRKIPCSRGMSALPPPPLPFRIFDSPRLHPGSPPRPRLSVG